MSHRQVLQWAIAVTLVMFLMGACGNTSGTPIRIGAAATSTPGRILPPAVLPTSTAPAARSTNVQPTAATQATSATLTGTIQQTATLGTAPATKNPTTQPFLMKIDRVSLVTGRGTLLEGRVTHGTLQPSSNVEILGPQNKVISTTVLAVLIGNTARNQVTVGDYARILVQSIDPSQVSPGMVLAAAGAFASYEEALQELH